LKRSLTPFKFSHCCHDVLEFYVIFPVREQTYSIWFSGGTAGASGTVAPSLYPCRAFVAEKVVRSFGHFDRRFPLYPVDAVPAQAGTQGGTR
jgi:hypothetical protein